MAVDPVASYDGVQISLEPPQALIIDLGGLVSVNASRAFDALEVSVRSALPVSSISSEILSQQIAILHDSHAEAWRHYVAALATSDTLAQRIFGTGATSDPTLNSKWKDLQRPRGQVEEEREKELDKKLAVLRTKLRNAEAAQSALHLTTTEIQESMDVLSKIEEAMSEEDTDVSDMCEEMNATRDTMSAVRLLLEQESPSVPLLAKVAKAVAAQTGIVQQSALRLKDSGLTDLQLFAPGMTSAVATELVSRLEPSSLLPN